MITALVKDQYGAYVEDGTTVYFEIEGAEENLGTLSDDSATTENGQAKVTYSSPPFDPENKEEKKVTIIASCFPAPSQSLVLTLTPEERPYIKLTKTLKVTHPQNFPDLVGAVSCYLSFLPWYIYVLALVVFVLFVIRFKAKKKR